MFLLNGKTEKTISSLKSLLLTDYEAKVYFTLLVLGESKPLKIAKMWLFSKFLREHYRLKQPTLLILPPHDNICLRIREA